MPPSHKANEKSKAHQDVQQFYGDAADSPQAELCCPTRLDPADTAHIPQAVIERFYGCGSPVQEAQIKAGETFLDLGSGAGIDCFIAAKKVGASGQVIGVDMTERMLRVAEDNKQVVADKLGYDVVTFKEGYLEKIPVDDQTVDILTSNCVINLSPDKPAVFREMHRVLKEMGRFTISDIISEAEVPQSMKDDPVLWGECLSGALTESDLLACAKDAGFYHVAILSKDLWKELDGNRFYTITLSGYKSQQPEVQACAPSRGCC